MPVGPCMVCGLTDYPMSFGGAAICPACDCGDVGAQLVARQRSEIERLRALAATGTHWGPISTVPEGKVFLGFFGSDPPEIGCGTGAMISDGYWPTATHWAPLLRPAFSSE